MTIDNSPERQAMAKITALTQSFYGGFISLTDALASIGQALALLTPACKCCVDNECECAGREVGTVTRYGEIEVTS